MAGRLATIFLLLLFTSVSSMASIGLPSPTIPATLPKSPEAVQSETPAEVEVSLLAVIENPPPYRPLYVYGIKTPYGEKERGHTECPPT